MASNAIHEMIAACSAGCMDKKNYQNFREYIETGGDIPVRELGELQNVIALLPIILELEKPSPEIKDKVAKKLISLQDEIKEKIKTTKQHTAATRAQEREKTEAEQKFRTESSEPPREKTRLAEPEEEVPRETSFETIPPPPQAETRGTEFYESIKPHSQPAPPTQQYELPPRTKKDVDAYQNKVPVVVWIVIALVFLILSTGLLIVNFSGHDYSQEITALEQRVDQLQQEVNSTQDFIDKNEELIQFMNYEDINVVTLSPIDETTGSTGKLMLSFTHREALLELKGMPSLGADQAFQVWLISDGRSYSLGSYVPSYVQKYIPIDNIPYVPRNEIELVRVTIEPLTGSDIPQGPAVLFGTVNGS
ncbi:MAG: anti-sigma factor [Melioribacteraceae bacterium]|nr:anti-sigma factor [Melioribacteraceae bacterium]